MKIPLVFKVLFLGLIPLFLLVFILISVFTPTHAFKGVKEELAYWESRGDERKQTACLLQQVEKNKTGFRAHAEFIRAYTNMEYRDRELVLPQIKKVLGDPSVYYPLLTKTKQRDIGLYASCLMTYRRGYRDEFPGLLLSLDSISIDTLPYVSELKADIKESLGNDGLSDYRDEFKYNRNNKANYSKLLISLASGMATPPMQYNT